MLRTSKEDLEFMKVCAKATMKVKLRSIRDGFWENRDGGDRMKDYILEIKPAIRPDGRHRIEDCLTALGYQVHGGGTCADMSSCDISFSAKGESRGG